MSGFALCTYEKRFGCWSKACEAAGFVLLSTRGPRATVPTPCEHCGVLTGIHTRAHTRFCSVICSNKHRSKNLWPAPKQTREAYFLSLKEKKEFMLTEGPFDALSPEWKRERVLREQCGCCSRCGIAEWLGQPLTLEVDHINGDNADNRRENLEGLCPNCHSQTPTWRGRNKKRKTSVPVDPVRLNADVTSGLSVSAALKAQGFAGKGSGHRRAKNLINTMCNSTG